MDIKKQIAPTQERYYHLAFAMILIVFVLLKIPHLNVLFYWDESWPYASGVYEMYAKGPSLLPGAISGHVARGHPLMFHFCASLWLKIFGDSVVALHSFMLSVSVFFLWSIYYVVWKLFELRAALLAAFFIAFQQFYFVQASFVLLELFLALGAFWSLYFYVKRYYFLTALSLSFLFLTKESGVVLGVLLAADVFIRNIIHWRQKEQLEYKALYLCLPFFSLGLFFILQKQISGWYVLPLYSQGLEHDLKSYYLKLRAAIEYTTLVDLRYVLFASALMALFYSLKKTVYKVLILLLIISCCFILFGSTSNPFFALFLTIVFVASWLILMYQSKHWWEKLNTEQYRFISLIALFYVLFIAFTAYNLFYINRYLFITLIPLIVLFSILTTDMMNKLFPKLYIPVLVGIACLQGYNFYTSKGIADDQIGAYDALKVQTDVARYIEMHYDKNTHIASGGYLERVHLSDINTKFVSGKDSFSNVRYEIDTATQVVIFDYIEPDTRYESIQQDSSFIRVHRIQYGEAWAEIFVRRQH